jgi:uncharacterized membrane protein YfcA
MNNSEFFIIILFLSVLSGFLGSVSGLGGSMFIISALVLIFSIDIHFAIAAGLLAIIATTSGVAGTYLKEGFINFRIGLFLSTAAVFGAVIGSAMSSLLPDKTLVMFFGFVLLSSVYIHSRINKGSIDLKIRSEHFSDALRLSGQFKLENSVVKYKAYSVRRGYLVMIMAGIISGTMGTASLALKTIAMEKIMRIPPKVSTATGNFILGIIAATASGIYLSKGYVDPVLSAPVILGILAGSLISSAVFKKFNPNILKTVSFIIIVILGVFMLYFGSTGIR